MTEALLRNKIYNVMLYQLPYFAVIGCILNHASFQSTPWFWTTKTNAGAATVPIVVEREPK